jgi:hypothetical protein
MATTRIERMSWRELAARYNRARKGSPARKAIEREARRCGYNLPALLSLHRHNGNVLSASAR